MLLQSLKLIILLLNCMHGLLNCCFCLNCCKCCNNSLINKLLFSFCMFNWCMLLHYSLLLNLCRVKWFNRCYYYLCWNLSTRHKRAGNQNHSCLLCLFFFLTNRFILNINLVPTATWFVVIIFFYKTKTRKNHGSDVEKEEKR